MWKEYIINIFILFIYHILAAKVPPPVILRNGPLAVTEQDQKSTTWPQRSIRLGQVVGIDLDRLGNIHVFHRGSMIWHGGSFGFDGSFLERKEGPIKEATLLVLNKNTGRIISEKGANMFYMPHGLTVDRNDNIWVTDVALHQVMKFEPGESVPSMILGKRFEPGASSDQFCQPTDVAVSNRTGEFFVADGYCNSRIMKFSRQGRFQFQWDAHNAGRTPGRFAIPHSITLAEDWDLICVADRENQRIQCFSAGLNHRGLPVGTFIKEARNIGRVYAIDNHNHNLVAVTNRGFFGELPRLLVMDLETGRSKISEPGLVNPHDVTAELDDHGNVRTIFVAEIGPNVIRRIQL